MKKQPEFQDYLDAIATYDREFKKWETRVDKILKRYRDETRDNKNGGESKFNILWSNVQTLVPATFSRLPVPDVTRRFKDNDPVGRVAALILERCLDFEVQHYPDYRNAMNQSVHDRFLGGRASAWIRYEPHFKAIDEPINGLQVTEDIDEAEVQEQLDYECVPVDYVHWKDFGHNVARTWEEVTLVWRKVYMNESAVKERFGEDIAKKIPYDASPDELKRASREGTVIKKQALVYELWDKEKNRAVWFNKSIKELLDERDDPLGLQEFFPCPRPLFSTLTNESLIPVPDFTLYQDQANSLDILSDRIDGLARMLQLKGVYDASEPSLARLFTEGSNGSLLPIKNYGAFAEKGGLMGGVETIDLKPLAEAMRLAMESMEQVKNQVYEITGISDIIRGVTEASETLGAQQLKGQYASLRIKDTQRAVAEYATEILRLKAQVMCLKFDPKTLAAMAAVEQLTPEDQQMVPQAMALLVGEQRLQDPEADAPNPMRSFRIEIAADTLVELDEQQEKQDRMELLTAFGGYLKQAAEVGMMAPQMVPLIIEVGKFGLSGFKIGKAIEGTFDTALDQLKQAAGQPQKTPEQAQEEIAMAKEKAAQEAKNQVTIDNAGKETALNKKAADLDVREIALKAKESELKLREEVRNEVIAMQDEHKAKLQEVDDHKRGLEDEHKQAMDKVGQREQGLDMEEKVMGVTGDLEKKVAVADERIKAAKDASKTADDKSGQLEKAMAQLIEAEGKTQEMIKGLAEVVGKPRKNTLVRDESGKASHSISEVT